MKVWIAILPVVAGGLFAQGTHSYQAEDFGSMDVMGVCNVTADKVDCWNPSGKPDSKLTEMVNTAISKNSRFDLTLKYKRRNRLIVTHQSIKPNAAAKFTGDIVASSGQRVKSGLSFSQGGSGDIYSFHWYYPPADELETDFVVTLDVKMSDQGSLTLKDGAETKFGAYTVKIESVREGNPGQGIMTMEGVPVKSWQVVYTVDCPTGETAPRLFGTPLDAKGEPIAAVDKSGNPVKPAKSSGTEPQFVPPVFHTGLQRPPATAWISRVKPDKVSQLKLDGMTTRKVTFSKIALDPSK